MRYENLQIVKVALAVVTPWSLELLLQIWIPLSLFRHRGYCSRCLDVSKRERRLKKGRDMKLVFYDEKVSPEEKMAALPRFADFMQT